MTHDDRELMFTPGWRLAEMVAAREVSPVELTEACLRRIDELEPKLHAFLHLAPEYAMNAAREAESAVMRGDELGPLHGVPIPIKDTEAVEGMPHTIGSLLYKDRIADADSLPAERIKGAGAIVVGKTNLPEFGHAGFTENRLGPPCCNPWNLDHTPGGSSGGSAAGVAAGVFPVGHGGDGGGSIRIPASFSGLYGIKGTQGRMPRRPAGDASFHPINHSSGGPITRDVRDSAVMMNVMAGPAPDAEYLTLQETPPDFTEALGRGVKGLRIAWSPDIGGAAVDGEVKAAAQRAAQSFEELGATVEEPGFKPDEFDNIRATFSTYWTARTYAGNPAALDQADLLTDYVRTDMEIGRERTAAEYIEALNNVGKYRAYVSEFFERFDLLMTPTTAVTALEHGKRPAVIGGVRVGNPMMDYFAFTYLFNLTGNTAANVPCGFSSAGLPIGLHVVGRLRDEETVLAASAGFEEAHPWADRKPPVS